MQEEKRHLQGPSQRDKESHNDSWVYSILKTIQSITSLLVMGWASKGWLCSQLRDMKRQRRLLNRDSFPRGQKLITKPLNLIYPQGPERVPHFSATAFCHRSIEFYIFQAEYLEVSTKPNSLFKKKKQLSFILELRLNTLNRYFMLKYLTEWRAIYL